MMTNERNVETIMLILSSASQLDVQEKLAGASIRVGPSATGGRWTCAAADLGWGASRTWAVVDVRGRGHERRGPGDRVGPRSDTVESVIDVQFQRSVRRSSSPKARSLNFQILVRS